MVFYAFDRPFYRYDSLRASRSDPVEQTIAQLLDDLAIEYYYEAVHFPHEWDIFGNVSESSNPDFYLPATSERVAIVIEATIVGHPDLPAISRGKYTEDRGRAALRRKFRQAGRRLYYHGINTLIVDWPLCERVAADPEVLVQLIERTACRNVIMTHRRVA